MCCLFLCACSMLQNTMTRLQERKALEQTIVLLHSHSVQLSSAVAATFAGAFKLAEIDLAPLLPSEALAPFAEEISGRQRRRDRKAEQDARTAQREAAAAVDAAAAAASKGLTARELKVGSLSCLPGSFRCANIHAPAPARAVACQELIMSHSPEPWHKCVRCCSMSEMWQLTAQELIFQLIGWCTVPCV